MRYFTSAVYRGGDGKAELVFLRQGLRAKRDIESSCCSMTTDGKVGEWLFVASTPSPVKLVLSSG